MRQNSPQPSARKHATAFPISARNETNFAFGFINRNIQGGGGSVIVPA